MKILFISLYLLLVVFLFFQIEKWKKVKHNGKSESKESFSTTAVILICFALVGLLILFIALLFTGKGIGGC